MTIGWVVLLCFFVLILGVGTGMYISSPAIRLIQKAIMEVHETIDDEYAHLSQEVRDGMRTILLRLMEHVGVSQKKTP